MAVELTSPDEVALQGLIKITRLGLCSVTCSRPDRGVYRYGTIAPIGHDTDLSAMQDRLKIGGGARVSRQNA